MIIYYLKGWYSRSFNIPEIKEKICKLKSIFSLFFQKVSVCLSFIQEFLPSSKSLHLTNALWEIHKMHYFATSSTLFKKHNQLFLSGAATMIQSGLQLDWNQKICLYVCDLGHLIYPLRFPISIPKRMLFENSKGIQT